MPVAGAAAGCRSCLAGSSAGACRRGECRERRARRAAPRGGPDPVVRRAEASGIVLEWHAPAYTERWAVGADTLPYVLIEAPGWWLSEEPGRPRLPFASALIVVPAEADLTLHVGVLESEERALSYPVLPAGQLAAGGELAWAFDSAVYDGVALDPSDAVVMEEVGWMRGHRLVRLTFFPLRFDPTGPAVEVALSVRVELAFEGGGEMALASEAGGSGDDPVLAYLEQAVVNPAGIGAFAYFEPLPQPVGMKAAVAATAAPTDTEYLINAHADLIAAAGPLAEHRE
ncbi:MAG: hypothetical protein E3J64_04740, partial [Anaerolineales bacterium]